MKNILKSNRYYTLKHPKYIILKGVGFFTMQSFIVYPVTHCWWYDVQHFIPFQFDHQSYFFRDLVLIEDQLILIFYEKMGLKDEEPKWKKVPHIGGML